MIPAAVTMAAVGRLGLFPNWLARTSTPIAVMLALTSSSVITMVLLPVWVPSPPSLWRSLMGRPTARPGACERP